MTLALAAGSCGNASQKESAVEEVRSAVRRFAALGREHAFAQICREQLSPAVKRLDELVGGNCPRDIEAVWEEGVQFSRVSGDTRITVYRDVATVFDGAASDRLIRYGGRWVLAEWPRNDRFRTEWEACKAATAINAGLKTRHLPLIEAATQLGCPTPAGS